MRIHKVVRRHLDTIKVCTLHHLNHHRLFWSIALGITFLGLGYFLSNEACKHFAEYTLIPAAEAIISKHVD